MGGATIILTCFPAPPPKKYINKQPHAVSHQLTRGIADAFLAPPQLLSSHPVASFLWHGFVLNVFLLLLQDHQAQLSLQEINLAGRKLLFTLSEHLGVGLVLHFGLRELLFPGPEFLWVTRLAMVSYKVS